MDSVNNSISGGTFNGPVFMAGAIAPRAPLVPRMLPHGPDGFVDRETHRARLDELLATRHQRATPLLVLLHGTPWAGKTGLALHWARRRQGEFPGGAFYAEMSPDGLGATPEPAAVLESFIGMTGAPRAELPATEAELAARFRGLTDAEPVLVVLDGVARASDVARLLPGHPASMVVMTSRFRLGAFAPDRLPVRIGVGELPEEACAELFRAVAGEEADASAAAFGTVIRAAAGLPLVVRIAAAQAADPLSGGVEGLAARVAGQPSVLEVIGVSLDLAYAALDPAAQRGLRLLGAHPGPEFADAFLDALAPGALAGLYAAGLLERAAPARSRLNGALHGHARVLGAAEERENERLVTDWYLRRAAAAEHTLSGRWHHGPLFAEPEALKAVFGQDKAAAVAALEPDRHNLAAVARRCAAADPAALCQLAEAVHGLFFSRGHHSLWIDIVRPAVEAAGRTGDGLALARAHFELAFALADRGSAEDLAEAREQYDKARECARRIGHARTESSALEGLGQLAARSGDPLGALELYGRARAALGDVEHPRGHALLEYHRGNAASAAGRHEEAAAHLGEALRRFLALERPDTGNAAKTRLRLARAHLAAGRPEAAEGPLGEALSALTERTVDRADAFLVRGDVRLALGDAAAARADWRYALERYTELGSVRAEEARVRLARAPRGLPSEPGEPQR
ncbi:tetratricopeptide repeat protein [Streptomyces sp. NBC_00091]|uniref:tetratricopeptide repeat protein n=1 Tax=Streptomyces sp. NBC_00091 TaxID=2975648 RepID=UPI00225363DD|nr:tetratricopeptide repeat protein [Streptomyces sp. NBC_00091]MCX5377826.1 tetratricopeptide repeat protein [Streptomyces sp. NBC_00091]